MIKSNPTVFLISKDVEEIRLWSQKLGQNIDLRVLDNCFFLIQLLNQAPESRFTVDLVIDCSDSAALKKFLKKKGIHRIYSPSEPVSLKRLKFGQIDFVHQESGSTWIARTREKRCEELLRTMSRRAEGEMREKLETCAREIHNGIYLLERLYYDKGKSSAHKVLRGHINQSPEVADNILKSALGV